MATMDIYTTGARRGSEAGKPNPDLIPEGFITWVLYHRDKYPSGITSYTPEFFTTMTGVEDAVAYVLRKEFGGYYSDYDAVYAYLSLRYAMWLAKGAELYGAYNWQQGIPRDRVVRSLIRHLWAYTVLRTNDSRLYRSHVDNGFVNPLEDEDHLCGVLFNAMLLWWEAKTDK